MQQVEDYLPLSMLDVNRVCVFEKWIRKKNMENLMRQICMRSVTDENLYHKYCGFNRFEVDTFRIDGSWTQVDYQFMSEICDPTSTIFTLDKSINFDNLYKTYRCYRTMDNYSVGFMVFISDDLSTVHVYGRTTDVMIDMNINCDEIFNRLIAKYNPMRVFIGTSEYNEMTDFSGGYGSRFDGNSILLQINYNTYVHIGIDMYQFTTPEEITSYSSSVGNNCVPYAYAESVNWGYCMSEKKMTPISQHPDRKKTGCICYVKSADYHDMDITRISGRDSWDCKSEISPNTKTHGVRFLSDSELTFMKNTCRDESLAAVQGLRLNDE